MPTGLQEPKKEIFRFPQQQTCSYVSNAIRKNHFNYNSQREIKEVFDPEKLTFSNYSEHKST